MSDSRLEKFIYAICSMDVTDLPVPLSRIEKLWNCLITGEIPDFEPLSRNEKYLMAMLDRYDISNLPAPMSRGEKLLYKIAVGETDLSDVPGYLSRYEELLKYLIENGGISGGDFEYVLYTLNQSLYTLYTTAEKPVKSAILKGQTLVNLFNFENDGYYSYSNGILTVSTAGDGRGWDKLYNSLPSIKPNTKYLFKVKNVCNDRIAFNMTMKKTNGSVVFSNFIEGNSEKIQVVTSPSDADGGYFKITGSVGNNVMVSIFEYQEGMENWDIPYFEGMQSVKMPVLTTSNYKNLANDIFIDYGYINDDTIDNQKKWLVSDFISIEPNVSYTTRSQGATNDGVFAIAFYDEDKTFINKKVSNSVTLPTNAKFARINVRKSDGLDITEEEKNDTILYLEKTTEVLPFESHKTNILSTPSDLELRGIGDVKDELNLLTGEVGERIGEMIVDSVDDWWSATNKDESLRLGKQFNNVKLNSKLTCDLLPTIDFNNNGGQKGVSIYQQQIILYTGHTNIEEIKSWIAQNPLTIQYELVLESIKTVDLTTVDQDNRPTQLGTFENVTHVSLESAGLIPEVEMEVATRISTELASASPLMDDISTNQKQLETMVDEQSNNVDATMIATTEIYEETL